MSAKNTIARQKDLLSIIIFLVAFLALWQLMYNLEIWPKVSFPAPYQVFESLKDQIQDGSLPTNILVSLWRLFLGFLISITMGVSIGLLMVKFPIFGKTLNSFAVGLQSFPSIAWIPFAILFIGINDSAILFVVVMSSVFSVMISTYSGMRNIHPLYLRAAKNMGAKGKNLVAYVMIPAATPSIIVGLKQAWSFAWHALIGAEMLITTLVGLGHILSVGREFLLMDQIIATMIVIFGIGMIFDRLVFFKIEEKVRKKWGLSEQTM